MQWTAIGEPILGVSESELRAMRDWATDCVWGDVETDELEDLSPNAIIRGIDRNYAGGLAGFLSDCGGVS